MRQETKFPESDTTRLNFQTRSADTTRVENPLAGVGGKDFRARERQETKNSGAPGAYVSLDREWQNGDRVEIQLPMKLHAEPLPGTTNIVAVLYGPIVLAGKSRHERNAESLRQGPA